MRTQTQTITRKQKADARLALRALGRRHSPCFPIPWSMPCASLSRGRVRRATSVRDGLQDSRQHHPIAGLCKRKVIRHQVHFRIKAEGRLKFIIGSAALSEISLIAFGVLPIPYNIVALYFNGPFAGLHVGSDIQFPRRAAHHRHPCQHHGRKHGAQLGRSEIVRPLCAQPASRERVLDACPHRSRGFSPALLHRMDDDPLPKTYGSRHRFAFGTRHTERAPALGIVPAGSCPCSSCFSEPTSCSPYNATSRKTLSYASSMYRPSLRGHSRKSTR